VIKIDRSFVGNVLRQPEALVLVESILAMARGLNMGTVAEGVEDLAIQNLLHAKGCTFLQGYLISKPLEVDALANWLRRSNRPPAAQAIA